MDARNLAIMFGPSLVRPNDDSMVAMVRDMSDQCRIVESIILHVCVFLLQGQYWAGRTPPLNNSPPNMAVANFVFHN